MIGITDQEFALFQRFILDAAGITLSESKKALVTSRLSRRLDLRKLSTFAEYFKVLSSGQDAEEVQIAIDLLTTNETYFFREPKHFDLLREQAQLARGRGPFRVWSAACSSGEETYSIAMVLAATLQATPFELIGSDISSRVLERARTGHYPASRTTHIPKPYLHQFCLRGTREQEGTLLVDRALRDRVRFMQINLNTTLPRIGPFDMIFLRNVMIYFSPQTKRQVVERVLSVLKPGGHLLIGHSETLNELRLNAVAVAPSIYRKP
ncbi:protein-glutamate O-methyltransferase CheR [Steroidobacter sp. S1-65]|uniref:Chemotaxis protein methyltransferase n=1 Tax=Steroidobacter gossypii TaxID=2805490 RepID=A0ABS1WXE2_9GAMM|nr:protein-glutamate O-methyltransferase CheR [Steroidobacter gossypii]MBM0105651.1 protein-glutamate O-methyltransferase CheR [Steroidobacter gossypii]